MEASGESADGQAADQGQGGDGVPAWQQPPADAFMDSPELVLAGAFVGGFLLARILRRLGS